MISLKGKVVLITGASRGIGAAAAVRFAEAGADVVINYLANKEAALHVAREAGSFGARTLLAKADVSKRLQVERMFDQTLKKFGRLDILVANAGIWEGGPIDEMSDAQWKRTLSINLDSIFYCSRRAAQIMKNQKSGTVVLISSTAGQRGEASHSDYAATKGAIISFTKSLAAELGPHGITVNSVAPGWVDTDMSAGPLSDRKAARQIRSLIPVGRVATADDIAYPIVFIASPLARYINGEILNVNGGSVLCG